MRADARCRTTSSAPAASNGNGGTHLSTGMSKKPWIWLACKSMVCVAEARQLFSPQDSEGKPTHDDVVNACALNEHVGDELGGDGRARLVLLVLAGVGEVGAEEVQ